jgi:hypothetical protein
LLNLAVDRIVWGAVCREDIGICKHGEVVGDEKRMVGFGFSAPHWQQIEEGLKFGAHFGAHLNQKHS